MPAGHGVGLCDAEAEGTGMAVVQGQERAPRGQVWSQPQSWAGLMVAPPVGLTLPVLPKAPLPASPQHMETPDLYQ